MVERGNGSEVRVTEVTRRVLEVVQAGVVPYVEALEWQRALAQARIERQVPHDLLLLLEHPPVVTLVRNSLPLPPVRPEQVRVVGVAAQDRKSTRLNPSHVAISYAVFCLTKQHSHA